MSNFEHKEFPKSTGFKNRIGERYHRLLVIGYLGSDGKNSFWHCKCDCGGESRTKSANLISGKAKSCGCWSKDRMTVHGHSVGKNRPMYAIWASMLARCSNPKTKAYKHYGARGIKVCDRWKVFENFLADMGERPSNEHSIDRIDANGNYEPSNCRWATRKTQANNTTKNVYFEHHGERLTVAEWADKFGMSRDLIHARLHRGWPFEEAILPPGTPKPNSVIKRREHTPESLREMVDALGL